MTPELTALVVRAENWNALYRRGMVVELIAALREQAARARQLEVGYDELRTVCNRQAAAIEALRKDADRYGQIWKTCKIIYWKKHDDPRENYPVEDSRSSIEPYLDAALMTESKP